MTKRRSLLVAALTLMGGGFFWWLSGSSDPVLSTVPPPEQSSHQATSPDSPVLRSPAQATSLATTPSEGGTVVTTTRPEQVKALAEQNGLTLKRQTPLTSGATLLAFEEAPINPAIQTLRSQEGVLSIAPNYRYRALDTPTDPNYSAQWNLPKVSGPAAWDVTTGAPSTVVAVIDTGVYFDNTFGGVSQPDLPTSRRWENPGEAGALGTNGADDDGNGLIDDRYGWDFMGGWRGGGSCPNGSGNTYAAFDNDPGPYSCDNPDNISVLNKDHWNGSCNYGEAGSGGACYVGHGTMVASVIAAQTNNGELMAGIDRSAKMMNLRVLDGYGFCLDGCSDFISAAIDYARAKGAKVINMSLGLGVGATDPTVEAALSAARAAGVVIVAASGNDGTQGVYYPASSPHVIAVGATDVNDNRASFSSYGPELDLVAPGASVPVANAPSARLPANYYPNGSGTSFATPHVAGAAALLWARYPTATRDQIVSRLEGSADKLGWMGGLNWTGDAGFGRLNLHRAVAQSALPVIRPNGLLIRGQGDPTVYLVQAGQKRGVPSTLALFSYGYGWGDVINVPLAEVNSYPSGPVLGARTGRVIKTASDPTVWVTDEDPVTRQPLKHGITSPTALHNSGIQWQWVDVISDSEMTLYQSSTVISEGSLRPNGVVIRTASDPTIWVIEGGQRRGFPTLFSLFSQNYDWSRVVTISSAEMASIAVGANKLAREGLLIQAPSNPTVYIIDGNQRRAISSPETLYGIGRYWSWITGVSDSELGLYSEGTPVAW
jgi:subtilisin family serine protease